LFEAHDIVPRPPLYAAYPIIVVAASDGIMDSGASHVLFDDDDAKAPCFEQSPVHIPMLVRYPNGSMAPSIASGHVTVNNIVLPAWVLKKADIHESLIGHAPFTALGCTIEYDNDQAVIITPDGQVAVRGNKKPNSASWRVDVWDINPHGEPYSILAEKAAAADMDAAEKGEAHLAQRYESVQERVNFTSALLGNAPKETVMRAMRQNWVHFAPCTSEQYNTHARDDFATHAGHMRELRQAQRSTRQPLPAPPVPEPPTPPPAAPGWWTPTAASDHPNDHLTPLPAGWMVLRPIPQSRHSTLSSDSKYKKRPGNRGDTDILVSVFNNYTHAETCVGKSGASVAAAYKRTLDFFDRNAAPGLVIDIVRIDNASSTELRNTVAKYTRTSTGQPLVISHVAVGMHRANAAEKAIQDLESAELSTLATTAADFPRDYWPELLQQVEVIHNHLKPWGLDPSISAWHGFHGKRYDFNAHPMTVAGALVHVQIDKVHREPDRPNKAKTGHYLGPSLEHYRCARILAPHKGGDGLHIYPGEQQFAVSLPEEFRTPRITPDAELTASLDATRAQLRKYLRGPQLPERVQRLVPIADDILRAQKNARLLFPEADHGPDDGLQPERPRGQRVPDPPNPVQQPQQMPAGPGGQRVWGPPPLAPHMLAMYEKLMEQGPDDDDDNDKEDDIPAPSQAPPPPAQQAPPPPAPPLRRSERANKGQPKVRFSSAAVDAFDKELAAAYKAVGETMLHTPMADARRLINPSAQYTGNGYGGPKTVVIDADDIVRHTLAAGLAKIDAAIAAGRQYDWSDLFVNCSEAAYARRALNLTSDRKRLTYARAMREPDAANWQRANDAEFYKLIRETKTMVAIAREDIPRDRLKDVCYYSPQVKEKMKGVNLQQRVRGTYGGNLLHYPGKKAALTAELEVIKLLLNVVVSENAHHACVDITDYYLSEPMERAEYLRIPTKLFSKEVLDSLDLRKHIDDDAIFFKVQRTMYGLPQAGYLAQVGLVKHLNSFGYVEDPTVPMLFRHETRDVRFSLVVDDFFIVYHDKANFDHLVDALRGKYKVTVDLKGAKYLGMTIDHDRKKHELRISMPGYVAKMLEQFDAQDIKLRRTPRRYHAVEFGKRGPQKVTRDDSEPATANEQKRLRSIVGAMLYLGRTVDPTILEAVSALASAQAKPTKTTMRAAKRLLGYLRRHPDHGITYKASDMQLRIISDASFNSRPFGRSVAGGIMSLGHGINGSIVAISTLIDVVVASAYEAELAAVFINMQRGEWLRIILNALGYPQGTTQIVTDNAVAVAFANDTCKQTRSKSVDLRFHWVRDRCRQRHYSVEYVKGSNNAADFHTKAQPRKAFNRWKPYMVTSNGD